MAGRQVITIAREYGSGGREIAERVASMLDIPFYDRELVELSAESSGWDLRWLEDVDEKKRWDTFIHFPSMISLYGVGAEYGQLPLQDRAFLAQSRVIMDIAGKGSCVFVGRCADYVLKERADVLRVFLHAEKGRRIQRIMRIYGLSEAEAKKQIKVKDRERARYYSYYTEQKWGQAQLYHLCVDSGDLGIEGTAELIVHYARRRDSNDVTFIAGNPA